VWVKDDERALIVVNSGRPRTGARPGAVDELRGAQWRLADELSGESYDRDGNDMRDNGLMSTWRLAMHVFRCGRCDETAREGDRARAGTDRGLLKARSASGLRRVGRSCGGWNEEREMSKKLRISLVFLWRPGGDVCFGASKSKDEETLRNAHSVLQGMLDSKSVPMDLLVKAECVVVTPEVKKFASLMAARWPWSDVVQDRKERNMVGAAMYTISGISAACRSVVRRPITSS